jgi:hypothetical protein
MSKIKLKEQEFKLLVENTVRKVIKEYSSDYDSQSNGDYNHEKLIGETYGYYIQIAENLIKLSELSTMKYEKEFIQKVYPDFKALAEHFYDLLGFNSEELNLPEQI